MLHSQFLPSRSRRRWNRESWRFLKTFPEFAEFPFMFFRVETGNTVSKLHKAMLGHRWCEIVLDEPSGANVVGVSSGFGDGTYRVEGLFQSQDLLGIEVEFIGPSTR